MNLASRFLTSRTPYTKSSPSRGSRRMNIGLLPLIISGKKDEPEGLSIDRVKTDVRKATEKPMTKMLLKIFNHIWIYMTRLTKIWHVCWSTSPSRGNVAYHFSFMSLTTWLFLTRYQCPLECIRARVD